VLVAGGGVLAMIDRRGEAETVAAQAAE
jgi:hypothetical protein